MIHNQLPVEVADELRDAARAYARRVHPGAASPRARARRLAFLDFVTAAEVWIDEGDSYADMSGDERAGLAWARAQGY